MLFLSLMAGAVAALASGTGAQPDNREAPTRFVLELKRTEAAAVRAPRQAHAAPSRELLRGPRARTTEAGSHSLDMTTPDNAQYKLQGIVGTPCGLESEGQLVELLPDTGSSDLWVYGSDCHDCSTRKAAFQIGRSCSANTTGRRVSLGYKDGTRVSGPVYRDVVRVGDLQVPLRQVVVVDEVGQRDQFFQADGTLGLATVSLLPESDTFVASLFRTYPELPKQFSFHLGRGSSAKSHLLFGDADLAQYSKEASFRYGSNAHSIHTSSWTVSVGSVGWSGTDAHMSFADRPVGGVPALVDSGTSLIVLGSDIYDKIMPELIWRFGSCTFNEDRGVLECKCPSLGDTNNLPWLTMEIVDGAQERFTLRLSPHEYMVQTSRSDNLFQDVCIPCFSRDVAAEFPIILGMTFLRSFYTVFDVENMSVGFARSIESPLPADGEMQEVQMLFGRFLWASTLVATFLSSSLACYIILDRDPKGGLPWLLAMWSGEGIRLFRGAKEPLQPAPAAPVRGRDERPAASPSSSSGKIPLIRMWSVDECEAEGLSARIAFTPRPWSPQASPREALRDREGQDGLDTDRSRPPPDTDRSMAASMRSGSVRMRMTPRGLTVESTLENGQVMVTVEPPEMEAEPSSPKDEPPPSLKQEPSSPTSSDGSSIWADDMWDPADVDSKRVPAEFLPADLGFAEDARPQNDEPSVRRGPPVPPLPLHQVDVMGRSRTRGPS